MTVNSSLASAQYSGDGSTRVFPVPFYFLADTHLLVRTFDTTGNLTGTLTLNTDFTVSGAGVQAGGSITLASAPTSTQKLRIDRNVPIDQQTDYVQSDKFPAEVTETALDKLTMIAQQQGEDRGHAIRYPDFESFDGTLLSAVQRALTVLGFDQSGYQTLLPIPASVGAGDLRDEIGSDGKPGLIVGTDVAVGQTQIILSRAPVGVANVFMAYDTEYQGGDNILSLVGNVLTLTSGVPAGISRFYIRTGTTLSLNRPASQSVDDTSLAPGSHIYNRMRDVISIDDEGGYPDGGTTDCSAALTRCYAKAGTTGVVRFPFISGSANVYYLGTMTPANLQGMVWDVDEGVTISVPYEANVAGDASALGYRFRRPTMFYFRDCSVYYRAMPSGNQVAAAKPAWLDDVNVDRSSIAAVMCNTSEVSAASILWPTADAWAGDAFQATTANIFNVASPTVDSKFHMGFRKVLPGDELTASMLQNNGFGAGLMVAMVRTTTGYYGITATQDIQASTVNAVSKTIGQAAGQNAIAFPMQGNHSSYSAPAALWSIRIDSWNRVRFLWNGFVMYTATFAGGVIDAGFGVFATAANALISVMDVTVSRNKRPAHGAFLAVAVFGDSTSAPRYDCWPAYMRQELEYSAGVRNWYVNNHAVPGQTSAQQLAIMQATGVADANVVVISIGTNDVQTGVNVTTFLSNVAAMVGIAKAGGCQVVLVNFGLWYTQAQAGVRGQNSINYDQGARYRSAILRLAAEQGCKLVDLPEILGPIWASYVNGAAYSPNLNGQGDPTVFDNIHPSTMANRLIGRRIAESVMGLLIPHRSTLSFSNIALTATSNGWAVTLEQPYANVDSAGLVTFSGVVNDAGSATKANGTVILTLPAFLVPDRVIRRRCVCQVATENGYLQVDPSTGQVSVYGITNSTNVDLSGLSWSLDKRYTL